MKKKIFIFLGKGGVGKTTLSASLAFWLAEKDQDVFWVSIDPAHNIRDIFKKDAIFQKTKIYKNLWVQEIDVEKFIKKYLKEQIQKMKQLYKKLHISAMEKIFEIIAFAPGMEETATLYAIYELLNNNEHKYIIIDTPPTGFTLKILALPYINLKWLTALKNWRLKILDKRQIIDNIKQEIKSDIEEDKVLKELSLHIKIMKKMETILKSSDTKFVLVLNPDRLSLKESHRIKDKLKILNFNLDFVLINKAEITELNEKFFEGIFSENKIIFIPFLKKGFELTKEDFLKLAKYWVKEVV